MGIYLGAFLSSLPCVNSLEMGEGEIVCGSTANGNGPIVLIWIEKLSSAHAAHEAAFAFDCSETLCPGKGTSTSQ